jgi:8-oxo-dGTP diphosphatase
MHGKTTVPGSVHVAAAVIVNDRGHVLLARRPDHVHQGGLWEFPGGKLEPFEDIRQALVRELEEELGLTPTASRPLIKVRHEYPDKSVLLDVWRVDGWRGTPHGREGQPVEWVAAEALTRRAFPEANLPIVTAARLTDHYLITPEPGADWERFLAALRGSLEGGVRLVQLRAHRLDPAAYRRLAEQVLRLCRGAGARLLLNGDSALVRALRADGVHLTSRRLLACRERPLGADQWVAASCHNRHEVLHAHRIGVDFIVVSPVQPTASHPDVRPLGWKGLRELTELARVPVYALGGMVTDDLEAAWEHGAQGIAAMRALWGAGG